MQRSISSKLREEWSAEFFDFYNLPTLTPEEVTKGMGEGYTQADLPRDNLWLFIEISYVLYIFAFSRIVVF